MNLRLGDIVVFSTTDAYDRGEVLVISEKSIRIKWKKYTFHHPVTTVKQWLDRGVLKVDEIARVKAIMKHYE